MTSHPAGSSSSVSQWGIDEALPTTFLLSFFPSSIVSVIRDVQHYRLWIEENQVGRENFVFVGTKVLKSSASAFAYKSFPTADTQKLTAVVANLVSNESLTPFLSKSNITRDSILHFILGYGAARVGVSRITECLLPYFEATLAATQGALDIPQIISYFRPGTALQGKSRNDRIAMIRDELLLRGIEVRDPVEEVNEDDRQIQFSVEVYRKGSPDELESTNYFSSPQLAHEYILVRARKLIEEIQEYNALLSKRVIGVDDKSADGGGTTMMRRMFTLDEVDFFQATAYGRFVMHTVKRILRFDTPFDEKLKEMGRMEMCLESQGWLPISDIVQLIRQQHLSTCSCLEPPDDEFIVRMLDEHDGLQRFQVGTCNVLDSPFRGVRCARALYAHHISFGTRTPLYRVIFDAMTTASPAECPVKGWICADKKGLRSFKSRGFKLFDNNLLVSVMLPQHLHQFERYLSRTAVAEHGGQKSTGDSAMPASSSDGRSFWDKCVLDERVKTSMFFIEVYLRAMAHDPQVTLKIRDSRGDIAPQYVALPSGHRFIKSAKGIEHVYFPIGYISGRTLELKVDAESGKIHPISGMFEVPPDPVVQFREGELEKFLSLGGVEKDKESLESEIENMELEEVPTEALVPAEVVKYDDTEVRQKITAFHEDPNVVMMEIEIPRCSPLGISYFDRTKTMSELKRWITFLGLWYQDIGQNNSSSRGGGRREQQQNSPVNNRHQCDIFLIKKVQAFPEYVVDAIMNELDITVRNRSLIRQAITRESINKEENYERLEFIGDAVLDYIVALDAALVLGNGPLHRLILQVAVDVCRNEILCELLPLSLDDELRKIYGESIHMKTKADMFEALVGAVYEDRLGLEMVRKAIKKMYQRLTAVWNATTIENAEKRWKIQLAMQLCPYVDSSGAADALPQTHPLTCYEIILGVTNQEESQQHYSSSGGHRQSHHRPFFTAQSHKAAYGLPRIQDKDYATHFTTGTVYSYRRIDYITQHQKLLNRILSLYMNQEIGFVNETLTERTKLTFDIDGVDIHSLGIWRAITYWFHQAYPPPHPQCGMMGIVLNCSGMSVVSKKKKNSFHIHFPQVSVTLAELRNLTGELRNYLVRYFIADVRFGMESSGTGKMAVFRNVSTTNAKQSLCRVVLDFSLVFARYKLIAEQEAKLEEEVYVANGNQFPVGWQPPSMYMRFVLPYLNLVDVLRWARACRATYRAVTRFMFDLATEDPLALHRIVKATNATTASGASPLNSGNSSATPLSETEMSSALRIGTWAKIVRVMAPPFESFANSTLMILHNTSKEYTEVTNEKVLDPFVEDNGYLFQKKSMKTREYFDTFVKTLLEQSKFDRWFWEKTVDSGLAESQKLRLYLNDKFDTVYGQEYRPLLMDSILDAPNLKMETLSPNASSNNINNSSSSVPQVIGAHSTMLNLSSLRCPEVYDADGLLVPLWDDSVFHGGEYDMGRVEKLLSVDEDDEEYLEKLLSASERAESTATCDDVPYFKEARQSQLPTFTELQRSDTVACNDWQLWAAGAFSVIEVKKVSAGKVQRHAALTPSWWTYRHNSNDPSGGGTARFVVGGHTYLVMEGTDMFQCLSERGQQGMLKLSRIITPHVNVQAEWRHPVHCSSYDAPMFCEWRLGGGGGGDRSHITAVRVPDNGNATSKLGVVASSSNNSQSNAAPSVYPELPCASLMPSTATPNTTVSSGTLAVRFNHLQGRYRTIRCVTIPGSSGREDIVQGRNFAAHAQQVYAWSLRTPNLGVERMLFITSSAEMFQLLSFPHHVTTFCGWADVVFLSALPIRKGQHYNTVVFLDDTAPSEGKLQQVLDCVTSNGKVHFLNDAMCSLFKSATGVVHQ